MSYKLYIYSVKQLKQHAQKKLTTMLIAMMQHNDWWWIIWLWIFWMFSHNILQHGRGKTGGMAVLVEITTKVNVKIVLSNNIWKYHPYYTAIMCYKIYCYIKYILIATRKTSRLSIMVVFSKLANILFLNTEQKTWPSTHHEMGGG